MPLIDFGALFPDSRGNRLEKYRLRMRKDGTRSYVLLRGAEDIVRQVLDLLADRNPARLPPEGSVVPPDSNVRWTDVVAFDGRPTASDVSVLDLLSNVLTMRPVDELDLGIALDFYKIPPEGASDAWTDTPVGTLVSKKYWLSRPDLQRGAGGELADRLTEVATTHPRYRVATRVIAVPGTSHDFGERLARGVSQRLHLPACRAICEAADHRPAKEGHSSYELEPYSFTDRVIGEVVIVLDDVWRSGRTMRSVAAAAKLHGAAQVLGLVAARTMRNY